MSETQNSSRVQVDWNALRETKTAQIDQWHDMLALDADDYRDVPNALRGDSARCNAMRALQTCEAELDRIDVLEAIDTLRDEAAVCRARSTLASIEGSHGPAQQWTRLAMEIEERARIMAQEQAAAAAAVGDPDSELGRLAQALLAAPQVVREELARVLMAGRMPDDWQPSRILRLAVDNTADQSHTSRSVAQAAATHDS